MKKALLQQIKYARPALTLTITFGVLGAVVTIAQMALLSRIVSQVFLFHESLAQVGTLLLLLLAVSLMHAGLIWLRELTAQQGAIRVKSELRKRLFAHLLQLGPAYSKDERTGELVATLSEGIERLDAYVSRYLPQQALSIFVPLLIAASILPLDWISAALLVVTAPVIPLLMILVGSYAEGHTQRQWIALSRMSAHFLDVVQGLPTLKLFGRSSAERERIAQISNSFRDRTLKVLRIAFLSGMVLELMSTFAIAMVAVMLGVRLVNGDISFEHAFFVLLLAPEFYRPLRELGTHRHAGMEGKAAAQRMSEILQTSPVVAQTETTSSKRPVGQLSIQLTNVTYTYPGSDRPALVGINLTLPACTCTALVGRTGAGKSTLVNLLLRFMDSQAGSITVNGIPLTDLPVETWREYVAFVPQRPYLFHGSIRDNIRLARPTASDSEIEHVANLAGAAEFIRRLPQGYNTEIGERGTRLSAGQAQRIAIARAFLKDAPLLVLDEPTSCLDPESETLIRQALERLMQNRTVLVIAHRYNTIARAEHIAVLENGQLVEVGPQAMLRGGNGPYAHLMRGQVGARDGMGWQGQARGPHSATHPPLAPTGPTSPGLPTRTEGASRLPLPTPTYASDDHSPMHLLRRDGMHAAPIVGNQQKHPRKGVDVQKKLFLRILSLLRPCRWQVALAILLGVATVASNMALLGMAAYLIAAAAITPLLALLTIPMFIVRLAAVSRAASRYGERLISHNVTFHLLAQLRLWFYSRLEPLAPAQLQAYRSGDLLARLVADIEELQNIYLRGVSPFVIAILIAVLTFGLFMLFSPVLAWTALTFLAVAGLGIPLLTGALARGWGQQQLTVRAELNAQIVDGIQGVQDLLAYGRADEQQQKIATLDSTLAQIQRRMASITGLQQTLNNVLMNLAAWLILILAIPLVATKAIDGVYLGFLALVILASFEIVQPLAQAFQFLDHSLASGKRLFEVIDTPPQVAECSSPLSAPAKHPQVGYTLELDRVRFAYNSNDGEVLHGITLSVCSGSRVAVVGPSGSGKSTLVRLVLRFWDPTSGTIRLNGQETRMYTLSDLRSLIGVVAQDTYLFNDTVRNNLLLARPGASDSELKRVLEQAQLTECIAQLPNGLETWIGEQGLRLSGGERQRLAIARALLKNAPLLILDEATANLDPLTERAILDALDTLMLDRTTLVITHRLIAMERMDEILVLESGQIRERGTHTQLLEANGLYRQMFDVQNGMLHLM